MLDGQNDQELENARKMFRNLPDPPAPGAVGPAGDSQGDPNEMLQRMMQFQLDPKKGQLLAAVSQVDPGWTPALFAMRPNWETTDSYFNSSTIDVARGLLITYLHYLLYNEEFPLERVVFFEDCPDDENEGASRLNIYDALPITADAQHIKDRIPYEVDESGEPILDAEGKQVKITPDALFLAATPSGGKDSNGIPTFTTNAVLITRSFLGTAKIHVSVDDIHTETICLLRPHADYKEWDDIIPPKAPKAEEEAPKE